MAEDKDIVLRVTVDTDGAKKSIQSLRAELKLQKKAFEEKNIGSVAYLDAAKNVSDLSGKIKLLTDSVKASTNAFGGVNEASKFTVGSFGELRQKIKELKKEQDNLVIGSEAFIKNQEDLKKALQDEINIREKMPSLLAVRVKQGVDESEVLKKQAESLHKMSEGLSGVTTIAGTFGKALGLNTDKLDALSGIVGQAVQGFDGFKKATEAATSANLQNVKALFTSKAATVQGTVATGAQTAATGAATTATAALNRTLLANPFVAIAALILAVAGAYLIMRDSSDSASESQKMLNESLEKNIDKLKEKGEAIDLINARELEIAAIQGKSRQDLFKQEEKSILFKIESLGKEEQANILLIEGLRALKRRDNELSSEDEAKLLELQKRNNGEILKEYEELGHRLRVLRQKNHSEAIKEESDFAKKLKDSVIVVKTPLELLNEEIAKTKKELEEQALAGSISEKAIKKYKDAVERLTKSQEDLNFAMLGAKPTEQVGSIKAKAIDGGDELLDKEIDDNMRKRLDAYNLNYANEEKLEAEKKAKKIKDQEELNKIMVGAAANAAQASLDYYIDSERQKTEAAVSSLDARLAAGLISEGSYQRERSRILTEQFKKDKAAALITAGINTALAVTAGLATPPIPAVAIAAGIAGAVQMAFIASQPAPKFAKGGISHSHIAGGKPHSEGGTKFYGEDGSVFEAERNELITVVNKRATDQLSKLSYFNEKYGNGTAFFKNGGVFKSHLADGGFAARSISSQVYNDNVQNQILDAVANMPAPIVTVEDINAAQGARSKVLSRATF